jgi:hypothetical protein
MDKENNMTNTERRDGEVVLRAIKDAHRGTGTEFDREVVTPEDRRKAELAKIRAATKRAEEKAEEARIEIRRLGGEAA